MKNISAANYFTWSSKIKSLNIFGRSRECDNLITSVEFCIDQFRRFVLVGFKKSLFYIKSVLFLTQLSALTRIYEMCCLLTADMEMNRPILKFYDFNWSHNISCKTSLLQVLKESI